MLLSKSHHSAAQHSAAQHSMPAHHDFKAVALCSQAVAQAGALHPWPSRPWEAVVLDRLCGRNWQVGAAGVRGVSMRMQRACREAVGCGQPAHPSGSLQPLAPRLHRRQPMRLPK